MNKESRLVLEEFNVLLSADLRGQEVGFQGNKSMRYDFYIQWQPVVKLKAPLAATSEVLDGKKGPFNVEKYDAALMEMLYAVTDGIKSEILK